METLERLVRVEESTKSAHHRIDGVIEQNKAILELTGSVKVIATKMEAMDEKLNTVVSKHYV